MSRRHLHLSDDRYMAALRRQRERIAGGLEFWAFDSDTPGAKDTQASWGLCCKDAETWPDEADRLFPDLPGRHEPKYRHPPHKCPMDDRKGQQGGYGCYHRCAIFRGGHIGPRQRDKALGRYDALIAEAEARQ